MTLHRRNFLHLATGAAALPALARLAWADSYPTHPVRVVVGFAAGSTTDTLARLMGQWLSQQLGQQFVIENRPGAAGNIGAETVVNAPADGYTLLMVPPAVAANAALYPGLNFNFIHDIAPVAGVVRVPNVAEVHPSVPVKSIPELIAYAKANPGKLSYASGNTAGVVGGKTLANYAGVDMLHVPYKSSPPAIEDVIAGRVSMMFADFTVAMPHVSSKQVRALAVTRIKRSALFPDLPTLDEAGIKGFNLDAWAGLVAPAGTPPDVIAKLNGALRKIIDSPEVQAKFKNVGFEGFSSTPEELGNFIKVQLGEWGKMVKEAGLSPQ
jgi:tripartite-type tricarboxylate transporter receptor subunit TctC